MEWMVAIVTAKKGRKETIVERKKQLMDEKRGEGVRSSTEGRRERERGEHAPKKERKRK